MAYLHRPTDGPLTEPANPDPPGLLASRPRVTSVLSTSAAVLHRVVWTIGAGGALINFAIAIIVVYQIIARNVLVTTSDWVFQIATYLNAWAALLGISFALIMDTHIAVSALPSLLRRVPGAARVMRVLRLLVFLFIGVFLAETSVGFLAQEHDLNVLPAAGVQIPLWIVHLGIPVGGIVLIIAVMSESLTMLVKGIQSQGPDSAGL